MSYFDVDRKTNFGEETTDILVRYDYTVDDIDWIGNRAFEIPIHEFFDVARHTNYYAGYGSAAMPLDIIIVMKNGNWLERSEYDGSEWWRLVQVPQKPILKNHLKVKDFTKAQYDWDPMLVEACVHQNFKGV